MDLYGLAFDGLMAPGMGLGQSGQGFIGETSPVVSLYLWGVPRGAFITMQHHWSSQISLVGYKEGWLILHNTLGTDTPCFLILNG